MYANADCNDEKSQVGAKRRNDKNLKSDYKCDKYLKNNDKNADWNWLMFNKMQILPWLYVFALLANLNWDVEWRRRTM